MKTAGILTFHDCFNYGASLQAYATQKNFEKLGVDCEFIDYVVPSDIRIKKLFIPSVTKGALRHNIRNMMYGKDFIKRNRNFSAFNEKYLKTTNIKYNINNVSQIEKENFDYYVTGSDQTFALNLRDEQEFRKPFFFPYDLSGKKISYSSSMGENIKNFSDDDATWISEKLSHYHAISVRENSTADFIEKNFGNRPDVIFDPTITLNKNEWSQIEDNCPIKEKYILFYTVISSPWTTQYVKNLSKETGLPVVTPHFKNVNELDCNFIRMAQYGPEMFLSLIRNAEIVVTSSFHGTVFSMIYEKPFASLILGEGNRITTLLEKANMREFGFRENDEIKISKPNKKSIEELLEKARITNETFLKNAIK